MKRIAIVTALLIGSALTDGALAGPTVDDYPITANAVADMAGFYGLLCASPATCVLGPPSTKPPTLNADGHSWRWQFAHGSMFWHPKGGVHYVIGLIHDSWKKQGFETGPLGYPISNELSTADGTGSFNPINGSGSFDGTGRVSKFKGGELIWDRTTGTVSTVSVNDLVVDLPTPVGQPWYVIQANSTGSSSHSEAWAYCYDLDQAGPQAQSKGVPFVSAADAPIVWVDEGSSWMDPAGLDPHFINVAAQRLGEGRYASYMHLLPGTFKTMTGWLKGSKTEPQQVAWADRPVIKSGQNLGGTGDIGAGKAAYHLHFCVTTEPDRANLFKQFESVPVSFRNFSYSADNGATWHHVKSGPLDAGWQIRREAAPSGASGAPQIGSSAPVGHGTLNGQVAVASGGAPAGALFAVQLFTGWGEPVDQMTINTGSNTAGPWAFSFANVPAYDGMQISVAYRGTAANPFGQQASASASAKVMMIPHQTQTVNLTVPMVQLVLPPSAPKPDAQTHYDEVYASQLTKLSPEQRQQCDNHVIKAGNMICGAAGVPNFCPCEGL